MTAKNTLILIFISLIFSFPHQISARSSTSKIKRQVKTQRSISQRQIPAHIKRKALARRDLIRNYKKLSPKQKLRLLTSMVRTMAALELAHSRRRGRVSTNYHDSLFHPFWSLFIQRAYAADPETCFLGGHLVPPKPDGTCNWEKAETDYHCTLGEVNGVQCDSSLFPSAPCVPALPRRERRNRGINFYSTTQACAYADAHNIKKHIEGGHSGLADIDKDEDFVTGALLNNTNLWSPNASDWLAQRDQILGGHMEEYASRLAGHDQQKVVKKLQEIVSKCDRAVGFEARHCETFKKDLELLENVEEDPPPGAPEDPGEDDPDEEPEEEGDPDEEAPGDDGCFHFHELPGEHFCQVRVATSGTEKDHLIVRLEGTINSDGDVIDPPDRQAVAYRLKDGDDGKKYCKDSNFESNKPFFGNTSNFNSKNDICRTDNSYIAAFSYSEKNLYIRKENGNNMCSIAVRNSGSPHLPTPEDVNDHYTNYLKNRDNLSNFLPGTRIQCAEDIHIDDDTADETSSVTHANCGQLKNELSDPENAKCIDPDIVALHDATNLLEHHESCRRRRTITISIKKEGGESQLLDSWLENHQSFENNGKYQIIIRSRGTRRGRRGPDIVRTYPPGDNETFNAHLDKDGKFPHRRKHRTISDWLYGDGESVDNSDNSEGLNGLISELCPRGRPRTFQPTRSRRGGDRRSSRGRK